MFCFRSSFFVFNIGSIFFFFTCDSLFEYVYLFLIYILFIVYVMLAVDNIGMDLLEVGWGDVDWIGLAQSRDRWRALVNSVLNLRVP
jgi:hypothetical protein